MSSFSKRFFIPVSIIAISIGIVLVLAFLSPSKVQKSVKGEDCINLYEHDNQARSVVFLSYGYTNKDDFLTDAWSYINGTYGLLSLEPFKESKEKLNFYAIFSDKVICGIEDNTLICDDEAVKRISLSCPNDYLFVLGSRNNFFNFINPIRSSSYVNLASINTADNKLVVAHEFGHLFGRLADEYVEQGLDFSASAYKNCDVQGCPKWKFFSVAGCFRGCGSISLYRSTEKGIMRNYFESQTYGDYNAWLLNNTLYH